MASAGFNEQQHAYKHSLRNNPTTGTTSMRSGLLNSISGWRSAADKVLLVFLALRRTLVLP